MDFMFDSTVFRLSVDNPVQNHYLVLYFINLQANELRLLRLLSLCLIFKRCNAVFGLIYLMDV